MDLFPVYLFAVEALFQEVKTSGEVLRRMREGCVDRQRAEGETPSLSGCKCLWNMAGIHLQER